MAILIAVDGAKISCKGTKVDTARSTVEGTCDVQATGCNGSILTKSDKVVGTNIIKFAGKCKFLYEKVGPYIIYKKCSPIITTDWNNTSKGFGDTNEPILTENSNILCQVGGRIEITDPNQTDITTGHVGSLEITLNSDGSINFGEIVIEPDPSDPDFVTKTLEGLLLIDKTPSGKAMLASLDSGGGTTIKSTTGGNKYYFKRDIVLYNPYRTTTSGSNPWNTRPPAIGLAHELIHADHYINGTWVDPKIEDRNGTKPDPTAGHPTAVGPRVPVEELNTVGIPPYDKHPYSENTIRSEWNPPQPEREWY